MNPTPNNEEGYEYSDHNMVFHKDPHIKHGRGKQKERMMKDDEVANTYLGSANTEQFVSTTGGFTISPQPKLPWRFTIGGKYGLGVVVQEGQQPNWFQRKMVKWFFDIDWQKSPKGDWRYL